LTISRSTRLPTTRTWASSLAKIMIERRFELSMQSRVLRNRSMWGKEDQNGFESCNRCLAICLTTILDPSIGEVMGHHNNSGYLISSFSNGQIIY